jgi:hypothetical protein
MVENVRLLVRGDYATLASVFTVVALDPIAYLVAVVVGKQVRIERAVVEKGDLSLTVTYLRRVRVVKVA